MLPEVKRFHHWLLQRSPHALTHIFYTHDLKLFFAWADKTPQTITLHDVDRYITDCCQRDHAPSTINRRLAALRAFYRFLKLESDTAPPNPVVPQRHFIRVGPPLPRDAEDADIHQLFQVIDAPRDRAIFLLMLRCGLRVREVHRLSLPDLHLQPTAGSLPRMWVHGKNDTHRVVYLSQQALCALQAWLTVRPASECAAVFLNRFGKRLAVNGIQKRLAHYCHQAGVWITCHQFRHTFGRHLTEAHVPVTTIQQLMGHAHLRTTQRYLYTSDPQVQADYTTAIEAVSQRLALEGGAA